jgi:hypothetical protein
MATELAANEARNAWDAEAAAAGAAEGPGEELYVLTGTGGNDRASAARFADQCYAIHGGKVHCPKEQSHRYSGTVVENSHGIIGCLVGGTVGATFAAVSSVGLATEGGAIGGCFVGGVIEIALSDIF